MVHQQPAHEPRRGIEEMLAVLVGVAQAGRQPEKRLVNQGRSLKGVIGSLPGHEMLGQALQIIIDTGDELR